jgi:hypothetical protein
MAHSHVGLLRLSQDPPDRGGIQVVGFRTQPTLFSKLMRRARMQQAELIALALQKAIQIFPVARGCFQADQNPLSGRVQAL